MVVRVALLIDVNSFQRKETWEKSVGAFQKFILETLTKDVTTKDRVCRAFDLVYAAKFFNSSKTTDFKLGLTFHPFELSKHEKFEETLTTLVSALYENGGLPSPINKLHYMSTALKNITVDLAWDDPVTHFRSSEPSKSGWNLPGPGTRQSQASGPPALQTDPDQNIAYVFIRVPRTWSDLYDSVMGLDEIESPASLVETILPTSFFQNAVNKFKIQFKFVDMNFYEDEHWNGTYPTPLDEALAKLGNENGGCILPITRMPEGGPGFPSIQTILKDYLSKVAAQNC